MAKRGFEELGNVDIEQPVAGLGERRVVSHGIVNAEPDELAKQQVVVDLLHRLPLGTRRVKRQQKRGAKPLLRRYRLAPGALVE